MDKAKYFDKYVESPCVDCAYNDVNSDSYTGCPYPDKSDCEWLLEYESAVASEPQYKEIPITKTFTDTCVVHVGDAKYREACDKAFLAAWEALRESNITMNDIFKMAVAMGVDPDRIIAKLVPIELEESNEQDTM